jgi:hypothetical protein
MRIRNKRSRRLKGEELDNEPGADGGPAPTKEQGGFKYRTKYGSKYRNEQELLAGKEEADKFIEEIAKPKLAELDELKQTVARLQGRQEVTERIASQAPRRSAQDSQVQAEIDQEVEDLKRLGYDDEIAKPMAKRNVEKARQLQENTLRQAAQLVETHVGQTRVGDHRARYEELIELHPEFDMVKNPLAKAAYDENPTGSPDEHFRAFKAKYKAVHGREYQADRDDEHEGEDNLDFETPARPTGRQRHFARPSGGSAPASRAGGVQRDPEYVRNSVNLYKKMHENATPEELADVRKNALVISARKRGSGYYE